MQLSLRPVATTGLSALLLALGTSAQGVVSHAPYPAVGQVNSNNIYPFSTNPGRYQQIHDAWSFSAQSPTIIRRVTYRPSNQSNYTNKAGATVEVRIDLAVAATGITSATGSTNLDSNMDASTRKTVVTRKKFNYPASGATQAELAIFDIDFPFDSAQIFIYTPAAGRSLVVETRQYSRSGGYAFDFVSSTSVAGNGFSEQNGSYDGCPSASNNIPTFVGDAPNLKVGGTFDFLGTYDKPNIISVFTLGVQNLQAPIPGTKCILANELLWIAPGATNASNQFQVTFPVGSAASLGGVRFYSQMVFLENGANSAGIVTSRGLFNVIGQGAARTDLGIARIYAFNANPDSITTATSSFKNGLVTRFAP